MYSLCILVATFLFIVCVCMFVLCTARMWGELCRGSGVLRMRIESN